MAEDVVRPEQFIYRDVQYVSNYDGDTIDFIVRKTFDFGFSIKLKGEYPLTVRVLGVDTPELNDKNPEVKKKAQEARDFVRDFLINANTIVYTVEKGKTIETNTSPLWIETVKDRWDKYGGRMLAKVYVGDKCLTDELIKAGLGKAYDGGKKE